MYVNTDCDNFTVLLQAHAKVIDGVVTVIAIPTDAKLKQTVVTREIVNGELVQVVYYCCGLLQPCFMKTWSLI